MDKADAQLYLENIIWVFAHEDIVYKNQMEEEVT